MSNRFTFWSSGAGPIKSFEERKDSKEKGTATYLIGGSVQHYQHLRTCCVQYSPTHPTLARLRVSFASSMQLTMMIRSRHTPTTLRYPCSHKTVIDVVTV